MVDKIGVSVVICCYNSSRRLLETLAHLKSQVVPEHIPWEVIVIDNASTDGTGEVALALWGELPGVPFQIVQQPKPGLMNARMMGFKSAQYEFISFIDDDNWVADNWVHTVYMKMLEYPQAGAIGGRSDAVFEAEPPEWFNKYQNSYAIGVQGDEEGDITKSRGWLWGAGLNIRNAAWKMILDNGFSPIMVGRKGKKLLSGEDNEIAYMLLLAGWKFYYTPDLLLQHYIPASRLTWQYVCRMMKGYGRAHIYLKYYQDIIDKQKISQNTWQIALCKDTKDLVKQSVGFFKALIFRNVEGNRQVLKMYLTLGKLEERLSLLDNINDKFNNIDHQTQQYL